MPDVTVDILAQMEGANKVTRDLDKLNKEGEELHKTFSAQVLGIGFDRLRDDIQQSTKEVGRLGSAIDEVGGNKLATDIERVEKALEDANSEASKLGRNLLNAKSPIDDIAPSRSSGGGSESSQQFRAQRAGRALSGLSQVTGSGVLGDAAVALNVVDDIQDIGESFGDLSGILNPTSLALGAVTAGLIAFKLGLSASEKPIQDLIEASERRLKLLELERSVQDLTGDELSADIKTRQEDLADLTAERDRFIQESATAIGTIDNVGDAILTSVAAIGDLTGAGGGIEKAREKVEEYNDALATQAQELELLAALSRDISFVSDAEKDFRLQQELTELRRTGTQEDIEQRLKAINDERQVQQAISEAAASRLELVNQQIADIEAQGGVVPETLLRNQEQLTRRFDNATESAIDLINEYDTLNEILPDVIARQKEEADSLERIADMSERLEDIRKQEEMRLSQTQKDFTASANQRDAAEQRLLATEGQLAALESDRAKMMERQAQEDALAASQDARESALEAQIDVAKAAAEVTQIQTDAASKQVQITSQLRDNINAINAEFMRSELRAIQAFNLEQKRLREDTEDELKQAALENDVNAFLAARDSAVKQLSRGSEDFGIERQQAKEDRDLRLAELKQSAQQELELLKVETQNQLITLQQGGEARLAQVRALEEQLLALRDRFAQENRLLQERFQQEDYNARVQALNETLTLNRNNFETLQKQTANLAYQVGIAAAKGFFAGAQGTVDASIQVAINQGVQELAGG